MRTCLPIGLGELADFVLSGGLLRQGFQTGGGCVRGSNESRGRRVSGSPGSFGVPRSRGTGEHLLQLAEEALHFTARSRRLKLGAQQKRAPGSDLASDTLGNRGQGDGLRDSMFFIEH